MLDSNRVTILGLLLTVLSLEHVGLAPSSQEEASPSPGASLGGPGQPGRSFSSPEDVFDSGLSGQEVWKDFPWRSERGLGCPGRSPFQGVSVTGAPGTLGGAVPGGQATPAVPERSWPSKTRPSHSHACFCGEQGTESGKPCLSLSGALHWLPIGPDM